MTYDHIMATVGLRFTLYLADRRVCNVAPDIRGELGAPDAALQLCHALDLLKQSIADGDIADDRCFDLADRFVLREVDNPNVPDVMQLLLWINTSNVAQRGLLERSNQLMSDALHLQAYFKALLFNANIGDEPYCLGSTFKRVVLPELMAPQLAKNPAFIARWWDCDYTQDPACGQTRTRDELQAFALADADRRKPFPQALPSPAAVRRAQLALVT